MMSPAEQSLSRTLKGRPGTMGCDVDGCHYVDYPAWVEDHKRRAHPEVQTGYCTECSGYGPMVVTPEGLFHRWGSQCDDERNARHDEWLMG